MKWSENNQRNGWKIWKKDLSIKEKKPKQYITTHGCVSDTNQFLFKEDKEMKVDAYTNAYASTQATYGKSGTVAKRETVSDTKAADDKGVSVEFSKEGMSASKAAEESTDGKGV